MSESALEMAERHVIEGTARCLRQAQLVERMRRAGYDVTDAEELLANMEETLAQMRAHRLKILHAAGLAR